MINNIKDLYEVGAAIDFDSTKYEELKKEFPCLAALAERRLASVVVPYLIDSMFEVFITGYNSHIALESFKKNDAFFMNRERQGL
jgi:hypothetical protein